MLQPYISYSMKKMHTQVVISGVVTLGRTLTTVSTRMISRIDLIWRQDGACTDKELIPDGLIERLIVDAPSDSPSNTQGRKTFVEVNQPRRSYPDSEGQSA